MKVRSDGRQTKILSFLQLQEKRKNSHINKKSSGFLELMRFLKSKTNVELNNIFVSMTMLSKLGINPSSKYDTPIGIYSYPAKYVLRRGESFLSEDFQGGAPYFNVFEATNFTKVIHLQTDESECSRLLKELPKVFFAYSEKIKEIVDSALQNANQTNAGGILWYVTWKLAHHISKTRGGKASAIWNKIFRSIGVQGCVDMAADEEFAIIHSNEPTQAVFFSGNYVRLLARIQNKTPKWELKDEFQLLQKMSNLAKEERFEELSNLYFNNEHRVKHFPVFENGREIYTLDTMPYAIEYKVIDLTLYGGRLSKNCKDLFFDLCEIENVKSLKNFPKISGFSVLKYIKSPHLSVSVNRCEELQIQNGEKLETFEATGEIKNLKLVGPLLKKVFLSNLLCDFLAINSDSFSNLSDLPKSVGTLSIKSKSLKSLIGISNVKHLVVKNAPLTSLRGAEKLETLTLDECSEIASLKDVSPDLKKLALTRCDNLSSWEGIDRVKGEVIVRKCPKLNIDERPKNVLLKNILV